MKVPALPIHPKFIKFVIIAAIALAPSASVALGDMLELKTGQVVQGKFIAATTTNIRFQVDGQEQVFATQDVLNIGFSDSGDTSSAAGSAPPPEPEVPPDPPAAQAAASAPAPPAPETPNAPPAPPAAPNSMAQQPAGATQAITIPAGTSVLVRMIMASIPRRIRSGMFSTPAWKGRSWWATPSSRQRASTSMASSPK